MKPRALLLLLAVLAGFARPAHADPFAFRRGDRVVMIGGVLAERDQYGGHIESMLAVNAAGLDVTFRNLGRGGDTVRGDARSWFEKIEVGYQRLIDEVKEADPTVILAFYGQSESYAGESGIKAFEADYRKLLKDLAAAAPQARFVLISPPPQERLAPPLPDPAGQNRNLEMYAAAISALASETGAAFVDLYQPLAARARGEGSAPLTDNGIHFTEAGYRELSRVIAAGLGLRPLAWPATPDPESPLERLRQAVLKKNRHYFHRSRPQNWSYLFGHRKHEQGRNGAEIPQFDPYVRDADMVIQKLAGTVAKTTGPTTPEEAK